MRLSPPNIFYMLQQGSPLLGLHTCCYPFIVVDRTVSVPIITMLQLHLPGLVRSCLLLGERAVAHKASKIIVTALEGSRVVEGGMVFGWAVLEALLECLDIILQCQSAGALHWFFTLLNHVKWCNPWGTARKALKEVGFCAHSKLSIAG
ncbi:Baculoviral IAP repeat-containing protein 6 [Chionoecetes opilio]|uniref:Baculoviral IAP repeat-containing protein 6 n=1 Tax=Chionoecetes opilio TaxID=41210 RepID=A0A8J5CNE1_CHIOP|nr:Baculoviral IAP repeat-containing protein 6 [Chionoecetes opilio]